MSMLRARRLVVTTLFHGRLKRQVARVGRVLLVALLLLFLFTFVTPVRNLVAVYFVPGTMLQVSSRELLRMYWQEKNYGDYDRPVSCDKVKGLLDTVNWQKFVDDLDQYPAYDETYFLHLLAKNNVFGTTKEDIQLLRERYSTFLSPLSERQQREMRMVFKVFYTAMELFNMTYFLMEGSMLGVYRHHGSIPWDDDMDISVNGSDWFKVKQILHCIPGFEVDTSTYMMYKFFWTKSVHPGRETFFRYPNIDIFFWTEDKEYLWSLSRIKKHRMLFKKEDIFPLQYRPFDGKIVPVPKNYEQFCSTMYDLEKCVSRDYDHMKNRPLVPFLEYEYVKCDIFMKIYPFVVRTEAVVRGKKVLVQKRMLGNKQISNLSILL